MRLLAQIDRLLEPIRNRVRMLLCKAILTIVDDSNDIQLLQVDLAKNSSKDRIQRAQQYGFTSNPKVGSQVVLAFLNGNRDHGVALSVDDARYRVKALPEGGVAIYDYDVNIIKLTEANGILIEAPNKKVIIKASGDIEIGNTALTKLVNDTFATLFNNHTHNYVGFVGTGTPTPYTTSSPAKISGTVPVRVPTVPPAPPALNQFADDLGSTHLTSKVKAE